MVRWGHFGKPLLVFPTAGGDAEEIERFGVIDVLGPFIDAGRIKVYSVDSVAGRVIAQRHFPRERCGAVLNRFDACVHTEVAPRIRADCNSPDIAVAVAGASLGAFSALATLCRHPDVFDLAIAMSGSYDLEALLDVTVSEDFYFSSPLHYLPRLEGGPQLEALRTRFAVLPFCQGRWENPGETWRMAEVLGAKGIPNRVDPWGAEYDHDWPAWRAMLPAYVSEFL
jgi:esterase/lipase superfamily enzyme